MFSKGSKNKWALFLMILAGIVAGGYLGLYLSGFQYLSWLNLGADFGIDPPFALNLGIIAFSISFNVKFTISGVIGIAAAVLLYKKL